MASSSNSIIKVADGKAKIADGRAKKTGSKAKVTESKAKVSDSKAKVTDSKIKVTNSRIKCKVCHKPVKGHDGPYDPGQCPLWTSKPTLEESLAAMQEQLHTLTAVLKEKGSAHVDHQAVERHRKSLLQAIQLASREIMDDSIEPHITITDPDLTQGAEVYFSTDGMVPLVTTEEGVAEDETETDEDEDEENITEPEEEPEHEKIKPEARWAPVLPPPLITEKDDKEKDQKKEDDKEPKQPVVPSSRAAPVLYRKVAMSSMPTFKGYESIKSFNTPVEVRPPTDISMIPLPSEPMPEDYGNIPELGVEECKEAIITYYAEKRCLKRRHKVQDVDIKIIRPSIAMHYILETFTESRYVAWKFEPYVGQPIDDNKLFEPPEPWEIPCMPGEMFKSDMFKMEVPHSNVVKLCHNCEAQGFVPCHRCVANGLVTCFRCEGRGEIVREYYKGAEVLYEHIKCLLCDGSGQRYCNICVGVEFLTCQACSGFKLLRCYIQLSVKFETRTDDHILEASGTDMPEHLVRDVTGDIIFSQQLRTVLPIGTFPFYEIADASSRLVSRHRVYYRACKCVQQRQTLRGVPVTEVEATLLDKKNKYWVYGTDGVVYCEECKRSRCTIS